MNLETSFTSKCTYPQFDQSSSQYITLYSFAYSHGCKQVIHGQIGQAHIKGDNLSIYDGVLLIITEL